MREENADERGEDGKGLKGELSRPLEFRNGLDNFIKSERRAHVCRESAVERQTSLTEPTERRGKRES
jgi:hypothetical protein